MFQHILKWNCAITRNEFVKNLNPLQSSVSSLLSHFKHTRAPAVPLYVSNLILIEFRNDACPSDARVLCRAEEPSGSGGAARARTRRQAGREATADSERQAAPARAAHLHREAQDVAADCADAGTRVSRDVRIHGGPPVRIRYCTAFDISHLSCSLAPFMLQY